MDLSRRHWMLSACSAAALSDIAAAQRHAYEAVTSSPRPAFSYFDARSATEIDAMASQIIPSDDTPGAREAGVIYFIDRALATFDRDKRAAYQVGLTAVQAKRKELFPQSESIAGLTPAQQIALLHSIEKSEFFELVRFHTFIGFLGAPGYGGNRDQVGWKLIGFEDHMTFQPPFGYYDREAGRESKDGPSKL